MTKAPEDKLTEMPVLPSIFPTSPRQSNPISTQESESSFHISGYLCSEQKHSPKASQAEEHTGEEGRVGTSKSQRKKRAKWKAKVQVGCGSFLKELELL